jgi:hypothetical protein
MARRSYLLTSVEFCVFGWDLKIGWDFNFYTQRKSIKYIQKGHFYQPSSESESAIHSESITSKKLVYLHTAEKSLSLMPKKARLKFTGILYIAPTPQNKRIWSKASRS